ncbi:hypothetical protein ACWOFR_16860 [Carnobacterium gallinarum]|uniref:hypothetical protein n=1 Tax=Carnobacterium gallinarum TaxID=2749 RepID=UPI0005578EE7|nr:hypothetical protein [Carnobacterium gallinarum]
MKLILIIILYFLILFLFALFLMFSLHHLINKIENIGNKVGEKISNVTKKKITFITCLGLSISVFYAIFTPIFSFSKNKTPFLLSSLFYMMSMVFLISIRITMSKKLNEDIPIQQFIDRMLKKIQLASINNRQLSKLFLLGKIFSTEFLNLLTILVAVLSLNVLNDTLWFQIILLTSIPIIFVIWVNFTTDHQAKKYLKNKLIQIPIIAFSLYSAYDKLMGLNYIDNEYFEIYVFIFAIFVGLNSLLKKENISVFLWKKENIATKKVLVTKFDDPTGKSYDYIKNAAKELRSLYSKCIIGLTSNTNPNVVSAFKDADFIIILIPPIKFKLAEKLLFKHAIKLNVEHIHYSKFERIFNWMIINPDNLKRNLSNISTSSNELTFFNRKIKKLSFCKISESEQTINTNFCSKVNSQPNKYDISSFSYVISKKLAKKILIKHHNKKFKETTIPFLSIYEDDKLLSSKLVKHDYIIDYFFYPN